MIRVQDRNPNTRLYWESRYQTEVEPMWDIWTTHDLIEKIAALIPRGASVLDAGCGAGIIPTRINKIRTDIHWSGFDFSPASVEYCRNLGTVHFECLRTADIQAEWPFADHSFDCVLCTEVLEHLEKPDEAIREAKRVALRKVIVSVPNGDSIPSHEHVWTFTDADVKRLLGPGSITGFARSGRNIIGWISPCK